MRVTQFGESILRSTGQPVTEFGSSLRELANDMLETMRAHEGTGLAAQQVDKDLQFFVLDVSWHPDLSQMPCQLDGKPTPAGLLMPLAMANTRLELLPEEEEVGEEGCLSIPDLRGEVARAYRVRARFQDIDGVSHELEAGDYLARVIQHEYDHTQGVLFIDRMDPKALRALEGKLKRLKRRTRDWSKRHRKGGASPS